MLISRRRLLAQGAGGCLLCAVGPGAASVLPTTLEPLIGESYAPSDADERGLWRACRTLEENLAESDLVLGADDLHDYTMHVLERLLGSLAVGIRVYIVKDANFNASMTPNGMMIVNTGLLSRMHDEAQYATVLGHEAGHYFRKHSIQQWRSLRRKTAFGAFVALGANAAAGYSAAQGSTSGQSWINLANSINQALVLSMFSFSRAQESEADAYGITFLIKAGYTPASAAEVWQQVIEERKSSAEQRGKRFRDNSLSAYSTHPPSPDRMKNLADTASHIENREQFESASARREAWSAAIRPHFAELIGEQVKLNDPGASLYLIHSHARFGWTGVLRFYEGEAYRLRDGPGDKDLAEQAYAAAVALPETPAEAWRAHGYSLLKAGQREDGHQALKHYLELKPDANDAAMVRFSVAQ